MAFKRTRTIRNTDLIVNDGYQKIVNISFLIGNSITFSLQMAKDLNNSNQELFIDGFEESVFVRSNDPLWDTYFSDSALRGNGVTLIGNAYLYAKTLDSFSDAVDV